MEKDAKTYQQNKIVKFALLFLLILLFSNHYQSVLAQSNKLEKKISIVARNLPLSEILIQVEKKSGVLFSYSNQQINAQQKITLIARRKKVKDILSQLFSKASIDYLQLEKQLILKPKVLPKEAPVVKKDKPKKITINGYLKDKETGEALIGATIAIKGTSTGAITNNYGFYSLSLPKGNYLLQFSYTGYKSKIEEVELNKNLKLSKNLKLDETNLDVIVISAADSKDLHTVNPLKKINLQPLEQNLKKGISGENDLFQSIQSIPGISSTSDGSVFFFARGGNKDQNLILIDEAPVYHPSHLFGIISAVSPEAINDVSVYKNYFPVQYGGRLSSIVDISTKDGNMNNFGFYGSITPITTSLNFEGPFVKEKASYHLSIRGSQINWLNRLVSNTQKINFLDFHAKLNFKIGKKNRLYFSFYSGTDDVKGFETGINSSYALKWQNFASTLRWNRLYSDRLFSNLMLFTSYYDYYLFTSVEENQYWNSLIGNLSLKSDFTFYASAKNTIRFGASFNSHYFNPGNLNDEVFSQTVKASGAFQTNLYWGQDYKIFNSLSINYGLRLANWSNFGPTTVYKFDEFHLPIDTIDYQEGVFNKFTHLEPRIELIYAFRNIHSLQFSFNRNVQHLHQLSNSISPFTTLDIWMPSGPNIQPQQMNQFVLGYFVKFSEFDFSFESYHKKMFNQIEYVEGANMLLNPHIENELRFGITTSIGFELALKKNKGNMTGWINYSYSTTTKLFEDINQGRSYPAYYDKPHRFIFFLSYKLSKRWKLSANWVYNSGTRYSQPTGFYYYNNYSIPVYTEKNNAKLPDYHRLDLSTNFQLNKRNTARYKHQINLSFVNLYGRKNPISINFNKIENEDGKYKIPANYITENQLYLTKTWLLGVMPTISYQFNFQNKAR